MCRLPLVLTVLLLLLELPSFGQTAAENTISVLRTVKGRVIKSAGMPAAELQFGKQFKYVGGHVFILYGVARAEQHFFVDADKDGNIRRLYWVQFEGYLPTNTHSYDYKSPRKVQIGGLDFFADSHSRKVDGKGGEPGSDGAKAQAFLESKGFKLQGQEVAVQRLVHLTDKEKRNELMIIYAEDLAASGFTSAGLNPGGTDAAKWPSFAESLLARAIKDLRITTVKSVSPQ